MSKRIIVDKNTQVWSAAAWWPDSDPSMQAVALTAKRAEAGLEKLMREAARWAWEDESYPTKAAAYRAIRSSGPHSFKLNDLTSSREKDEAVQALEDDGIWYPPTL